MDKVSIIVPAYNAQDTIEKCLESLLGQTYKNIEVVVINDGSVDNTLKIIDKFNDIRLKVTSTENRGISAARNLGIKNSTGEFICFCDADDFYEKNYVEKLLSMFDEDVVMTACDYVRKTKVRQPKEKFSIFSRNEALKELFSDRYLFVQLWNKMIRKDFIQNLQFDEKVKTFGEDVVFAFNYLKSCPDNLIVKHTNLILYHYIPAKNSASSLKYKAGGGFADSKINLLKIFDEMIEYCKLNNLHDVASQINAWYFLLLLQFLFETRMLKLKELHATFKKLAKEKKKDYDKCRKEYKSYRRYAGFLLYFL